MKRVNINAKVDPDTHKTLKIEAIKLGIPIHELFVNILRVEAGKIDERNNK